jgi:hypothetical protein
MDFWQVATNRAKEFVPIDLDAMAADDDYIHTESLNVTKTTTTTSTKSNSHSQSNTIPVIPIPSTSTVSSQSTKTSMPSTHNTWSLLDRRSGHASSGGTAIKNNGAGGVDSSTSSTARIQQATDRLNAMVFDSDTAVSTTTYPGQQQHTHSINNSRRTMTVSSSHHSSRNQQNIGNDDDDDDDASQDSYDEDDPILSILQQQQPPSARSKSKPNGDQFSQAASVPVVDQRLASVPSSFSHSMTPMELETTASSASEPQPPSRRKMDWIWNSVQSFSSTTDDHNAIRTNERNTTTETAESTGPLWGRPKKKKNNKHQNPQQLGFVKVSSTHLGFSEEERQALANIQATTTTTVSSSSNIVQLLLQDHPRESFIAVTLVLGAAVYFYTRITEADDFAR